MIVYNLADGEGHVYEIDKQKVLVLFNNGIRRIFYLDGRYLENSKHPYLSFVDIATQGINLDESVAKFIKPKLDFDWTCLPKWANYIAI